MAFGIASVSTKARGLRALGRQIGQIDAQRLPRDRFRRIVREKMHAADDGVRGHHERVAVGGVSTAASSVRPERAGMCRDRLEIARDQRSSPDPLADAGASAIYPPPSNSSARNCRAS